MFDLLSKVKGVRVKALLFQIAEVADQLDAQFFHYHELAASYSKTKRKDLAEYFSGEATGFRESRERLDNLLASLISEKGFSYRAARWSEQIETGVQQKASAS